MDQHEFEDMIKHVLQQDFSAGTEQFRDTLLARCLDVLNADEMASDLDDADLSMLAAAGNASDVVTRRPWEDNKISF